MKKKRSAKNTRPVRTIVSLGWTKKDETIISCLKEMRALRVTNENLKKRIVDLEDETSHLRAKLQGLNSPIRKKRKSKR